MRLIHFLAALAWALLFAGPAAADAAHAVLNKEGVWGIDVDNGSCAASMTLQNGDIFLLRGTHGDVDVALFARHKVAQGKRARLETEAYGFDFAPGFEEHVVYSSQPLSARMVAALRLAREVRLLVDGRLAASATFENTGFEQALDGLIDCSNGKSGWWGGGVGQPQAAAPPPAGAAKPDPKYNKEDIWALFPAEADHACVAQAVFDDTHTLQFLGTSLGQVGIAVGATDNSLQPGRKGLVDTGAFQFSFRPDFEGRSYMVSHDPFDSQSLFALRRAKDLRVSVDGRIIAKVGLEGTGFPLILDELLACARGERGWWGEGGRQGR
jgi:hypothetical protein